MSDFASILPFNSSALEVSIEGAVAAARPDLSTIPRLLSPETCPPELLPWLAWAFSVDLWDAGWSEGAKRDVIDESVAVHRTKGTVGAVKRALAAAGYGDARIVERFGWEFYDGSASYDGSITYEEPDHWAEYRVYLTRPITIGQAAQVRAILAGVVPARCHLKGLFFTEALNLYDNRIAYDGAYTHGVA